MINLNVPRHESWDVSPPVGWGVIVKEKEDHCAAGRTPIIGTRPAALLLLLKEN